MADILDVRGLTRRFGGLTAVANIDLDVGEGELVSVIGPNGAGKTTLFNLISGLDRPDAGAVTLRRARRSPALSPERLAALGIARTFQHGRVFGNLSVSGQRADRRACALAGGPSPRARCSGHCSNCCSRSSGRRRSRPRSARCAPRSREILAAFGDRLLPRMEQSGLQPVLCQPPPGRDRPRAGAASAPAAARRADRRHEPDRDGRDAGADRRPEGARPDRSC